MTGISLRPCHAVKSAISPGRRIGWRSVLISTAPVLVLAALALPGAVPAHAATAARSLLAGPAAPSGAAGPSRVPPPPPGWTTIFSDDFNGANGSGIDSQWMYDTGPGSSFGTGEIE